MSGQGHAIAPDWIAVDWGTTHLRAYAMGPGGILAEAGSDAGMGSLAPDRCEAALLALIGGWLPDGRRTEVLAAGMVGSPQGWVSVPTRYVPCLPVDGTGLMPVPTADRRLSVMIVPGLGQASPPDLMRGEEVQIAGALRLLGDYDGVICLPGTHCKWVQVSAGEVVSFQTFMTGELFALLSTRSVLRHGIADTGWDDAAFAMALADAQARPERLAAYLFGLRPAWISAGLTPAQGRARLSGLLIGAELAGARPYWLGQSVVLVGSPATTAPYATALGLQGVTPRILPARDCTIAGLNSVRSRA